MFKALSIAGSDSGAGAGIQADLKTFSALGVYGTTVITAVTAQNTLGVSAVQAMDPKMVGAQIDAVLSDIGADAVKVGMLPNEDVITVVADKLREYKCRNIVLDPLLYSTGGFPLSCSSSLDGLIEKIFPLTDILTPNLSETERLTCISADSVGEMKRAARALHSLGPQNVLVKGGHLEGPPVDVFFDGENYLVLEGERIETPHNHGTGCTLSSAIAAYLAKGLSPAEAVRRAKEFVTQAIRHAFSIGQGKGPLHHFYRLPELK